MIIQNWTKEDLDIFEKVYPGNTVWSVIVYDWVDAGVMYKLECCLSKGPIAKRVELLIRNKGQ